MSGSIEMPHGAAPVLPAGVREANTVASQANRVTALVGFSGSGKSSLADTASEWGYERFHSITLCYAIDPGGFGNKRLALIKAGIMKVWDPRNHVNFFDTMEMASLGAWPETIEDPERGFADPYVKLIMPRRLTYDVICPQDHSARRFDDQAQLQGMLAATFPCGTCGMTITAVNLLRIDRAIVRDRRFKHVGLRIYDSLSAMSDQGLVLELPSLSAKGHLPIGKSGGSALGSADALRQGETVYGTGSEAQVGFMQNRAYGWLMNIRQIPDQLQPPIVTFGVEESKEDITSGGVKITGPRIAGKARTAAVPGWVGDLLFASHEPEGIAHGEISGNMVFRLYLTTHTDPRDGRRLPILAKHRGTPLGMPDYLEDPWYASKEEREQHAWEQCSLRRFYELLEQQQQKLVDDLQARYPEAPGFVAQAEEAVDEVIRVHASGQPAVPGMAAATAVVPQAGVSGGRTLRSRRVAIPVPAPVTGTHVAAVLAVSPPPPASTPTPPAPTRPAVAVAAPTDSGSGNSGPFGIPPTAAPAATLVVPESPSVIQQQLEASLAARTGQSSGNAGPALAAGAVSQAVPVPSAPVSMAPAAAAAHPTSRVLRRPRPPV